MVISLSALLHFLGPYGAYLWGGGSQLYVTSLKPLVGVEDIDTNGNTSCAPLWYSTAM